MKGREDFEPQGAPATPEETAADRALETFLDEALASSEPEGLPAGFTERLMAARPFAPWEVRRASAWRGPAVVLAGLVALSAVAFVLPLLRLGPGSAIALWAWVTFGAVSRPLAALVSSLGLLSGAGAAVKQAIPAGTALALGAGTLVSAAGAALLALRPGARAARG